MLDQLIIGSLASCDDFDASIKERTNTPPKKKSIKETVPFSNITYDFSKINGELYWEERSLKYVFEIIAATPEELEEKKSAFAAWVMDVMNEDIYDPFIENYHYKGTFESIDYDDDDIKSTITVTFMAYPYMISNSKRVYNLDIQERRELHYRIVNNSCHKIVPMFTADVPVTVTMDNVVYLINEGQSTDDSFEFKVGSNTIAVESDRDGTLKISFNEEVF